MTNMDACKEGPLDQRKKNLNAFLFVFMIAIADINH